MKTITREINTHNYTFAKYDVATGQTYAVETVTTVSPMTRKEIHEHCNTFGCVMLHTATEKVRYSLPLEIFVRACEEYARVEAAAVPPNETAVTVNTDGDNAGIDHGGDNEVTTSEKPPKTGKKNNNTKD